MTDWETYEAEIAALKAQLATARTNVLEEAAKAAFNWAKHGTPDWDASKPLSTQLFNVISALKAPQSATDGPTGASTEKTTTGSQDSSLPCSGRVGTSTGNGRTRQQMSDDMKRYWHRRDEHRS